MLLFTYLLSYELFIYFIYSNICSNTSFTTFFSPPLQLKSFLNL